jgi:hypothetical protein
MASSLKPRVASCDFVTNAQSGPIFRPLYHVFKLIQGRFIQRTSINFRFIFQARCV